MKSISRVLSFGLPIAAAIATISSGAAFAQTTSIPVSGTVSGTVFTTGIVSLNSYSLLSPVGTVSGTGGTITSVTTPLGVPITVLLVNTIGNVVGLTNGGVVFNDGSSASFVGAPTTFNATVTAISAPSNPSINFIPLGAFPSADTNVSLTINTGSNISIPTSSIVAAPVTPITTPTVIVQSPGIDRALVILDPAFSPKPGVGPQIVTAFSSDPNAVFASSLSSKVSPYLNNN